MDIRSTALLFKSIEENNIQHFELALRMPDLAINTQNILGETPLYVSLKRKRPTSVVMRLLQAGCNVNISIREKMTPLHMAMLRPSLDVAHELLQRRANINAQEECSRSYMLMGVDGEEQFNKKTPLHYAVQGNNLKGLCLLLYYGADVFVTTSNKMTPFKYALYKNYIEITQVLISFYDNSYFKNRPIVMDPFEQFSDLQHEGLILLINCLEYNHDSTLFKLLWRRLKPGDLLDDRGLNYLLMTYMRNSRFESTDWLECLHAILNVFVIRELDNNRNEFKFNKNFFVDLFAPFTAKNIQPEDRLGIINICLSLGIPVTPDDYEYGHGLYGFADELEALLYATNYLEYSVNFDTITLFILPVTTDEDYGILFYRLLKKQFHKFRLFGRESYELKVPVSYFLNLLGFYSLSLERKLKIKKLCGDLLQNPQQQIFAKLERVPEFPSLLELCRNQIRKHIIRSSDNKYPYEFHDSVKKLKCPEVVHDVIRFKTPIYL